MRQAAPRPRARRASRRLWSAERADAFGGGEEDDEQHAEEGLDVQVAPERDERHSPDQRRRGSAAPRALDEQRARGHPGEGRKVRARDRPRFENEPPEHQHRDHGRGCRPLAGSEKRQHERQREQCGLGDLDSCSIRHLPRRVRAEIEQPGRVGLRVRRVNCVEDVGMYETARGGFTSLRQVPPQIRLVDGAEAECARGRHGDGHEQGRPRDPVISHRPFAKSSVCGW